MKIGCQWGETISDTSDYLPYKAHFIPDQELFGLFDAIDDAIEKSGDDAKNKEAACMRVRSLISKLSRSAWQCSECGCVYMDNQANELRAFLPSGETIAKDRFRSR